jgi:hypothetical protein
MKKTSLFAMTFVSALALLAPTLAHADASCTALINNHINYDKTAPAHYSRWQNFTYVYIKDDNSWTQWSQTSGGWNNGTGANAKLVGVASGLKQLFSDRTNGSQPFYINSSDTSTLTSIDTNGIITMHDNTWNFDSTSNATCHGNTMIANSSDGTLIITIADAQEYVIP